MVIVQPFYIYFELRHYKVQNQPLINKHDIPHEQLKDHASYTYLFWMDHTTFHFTYS
jgi:hypothetical protein